MYPNDQSQPPQSTPESISTPSSAPEPISQSQPPSTPPKKSSGKIAVIVLIILSILLTATVIFLAVRLANPATSSSESDGSDVSGNNSNSNSDSSDEPSASGDDPVSSDIAHNSANPTAAELADIYIEQTGSDTTFKASDGTIRDLTLVVNDIVVSKSPIAPYEYLQSSMGFTGDGFDGGGWAGFFFRKDSVSDWVFSYVMSGHVPPRCDEFYTNHERKAFYGLTCLIDDDTKTGGYTIDKTISHEYPYYK